MMTLSSSCGRTAQEQQSWKPYLSSNVGRKAKKTKTQIIKAQRTEQKKETVLQKETDEAHVALRGCTIERTIPAVSCAGAHGACANHHHHCLFSLPHETLIQYGKCTIRAAQGKYVISVGVSSQPWVGNLIFICISPSQDKAMFSCFYPPSKVVLTVSLCSALFSQIFGCSFIQ